MSLLFLVGGCDSAQRDASNKEPQENGSSSDGPNGKKNEVSSEVDAEDTKALESGIKSSSGDLDPESKTGPDSEGNTDPGDQDNGDHTMGTQPKFDLGIIPEAELETKPCAIDFLFVVDNSGSMADEQENLRRSAPEFIQTLKNEVKSVEGYHIGVTGTDHNWGNPKECRKVGALITRTSGAQSSKGVCGPYAEGYNYMTPKDDLQTAFGCALKPGIGGRGDERPIDAIRVALSTELLKSGQCNAGFLRKEALLVVTVITDEEDDHIDPSLPGSAGDPPQWYKDLLAAKGNDPRKIVVLGLIGTEDSQCSELVGPDKAAIGNSGAQISQRLQSFVQMFGKRGFVGDVCAPNYGPFFKKAVSVIDAACDELPAG